MKPLNIFFSAIDGVLRTDDGVFASPGFHRWDFENGFAKDISASESAPDFFLYGPIAIKLWGQKFVAGVRFYKDAIHGITLTLELGKVAALGYDATEKDLLLEKKILTTMVSKYTGCMPSSTSLGADVFEFPWGGVITRADLKSTWSGIEVRYK